MLTLRGAPALSEFRLKKLEQRVAEHLGQPVDLYAEYLHFANLEQTLDRRAASGVGTPVTLWAAPAGAYCQRAIDPGCAPSRHHFTLVQ